MNHQPHAQHVMVDINAPNGWQQLDDDAHHSTVAYFTGGIKCLVPMNNAQRNDEILIWRGVSKVVEPDDGDAYEKTTFEGFDDEEVPEGADYLIEVHVDGGERVARTRFAQDLDDAAQKVVEEAERVEQE